MTELDDADLPQAQVVARARLPISRVWIIPAVAAAIAIGLAVEHLAREGPTITITFTSASGVEAGKTPIKYKDVTIGLVTALHLSQDYGKVEVTAKIAKEAEGLMTQGATFWIVRPRVTLSEVSGLGTLLSGSYIGFDRGQSTESARRFTGLEDARVIEAGTPGRHFILHATDADHVDVGLPVYFRGLQVGQVTGYELTADGRAVNLKIFVNAPYDAYVYPSTRFWNASGLEVSVGAEGLRLRSESLVSVLVGGIAFDNRPSDRNQERAPDGAVFTAYHDRATAMKQPDPGERPYVLHFDEPLDGITTGSPVTFLGIPAGEVTRVGLEFEGTSKQPRGRIEITLSPRRLIERLPASQVAAAQQIDRTPATRRAFMKELVTRYGMRAQLRSASLVTGQRYVAFEYFPHAPPVHLRWDLEPQELPVVPSVLPALEGRVTALLEKLDKLPLDQMSADARRLMAEARTTLKSLDGVLRHVDENALPKFTATMQEASNALVSAQRALDGASANLVGPEAPAQLELRSALHELTRAARSLRTLTDALERHPESILRGRSQAAPE